MCGSSASWMLKNIVKEKGSLYNRITRFIHVQPFTLHETKEYLTSRQVQLNNDQIIQLYMAMGGIPHYLKEVEANKTATQNIGAICFSRNGLLKHEYGNLYDALFTNSKIYKQIIETLFTSKRGLTKLQIAEQTKLTPNGAFYEKLDELVSCGFVAELQDLSKKSKQNLYRLIDEYSLFYHQFIKGVKGITTSHWQTIAHTPKYYTWSGYAFENLCIRHSNKIKQALQIGGMQTNMASFFAKGNSDVPGGQIDLIIDRADNCINLIECKFHKDDFYLNKVEIEKIKKRKAIFSHYTGTKKQLFVTLVSSSQLLQSKESIGLIDQTIESDSFFDK